MKLARKMKRKAEKSAAKGEEKARTGYEKAKRDVYHATAKEIVMQNVAADEMRDRMTLIFLASAKAKFKLSAKVCDMLRHKMAIHYLCWKDGTVTVDDIRKILLDESGMYGRKGFDVSEYCMPLGKAQDSITLAKMETFNAITAIFMLCLLDGLGYKQKRMKGLYLYVTSIMDEIEKKEITLKDLSDYLKPRKKTVKEVA
ncbi:hypothetical protein [Mitsuokella sp.]|uniref:hypothetical protein n=1 Tax=Mitsuokella sp. TaxID=2049034 RepID=UPI003D7F05A0